MEEKDAWSLECRPVIDKSFVQTFSILIKEPKLVSYIEIEGKLVQGLFQKRLTRFSALVQVGGEILQSFLPNPGRMHDLLTHGAKVILREAACKERKTFYDLLGVYYKCQQVSLDSRIPNKLVLKALRSGDLPEFSGYTIIKPERSYGRTKFDFLLSNGQKRCLLEVKSSTLVMDGVAMFPDGKTERGKRHVMELLKAKGEGYRAAILFIIQRKDADTFSPADHIDPKFGGALRKAAENGVEIYAYRSEFVGNKITLREKIKIEL